MKREISKRNIKIYSIIYSLVLYVMLIDTAGSFKLKNLVFLASAVYFLLHLVAKKISIPYKIIFVEGVVFLFYPIFLVFISVTFWNIEIKNIVVAVSALVVWIILPIILYIEPEKLLDKYKSFVYYGSIIIIATFFILLFLALLGRLDLVAKINQFCTEYSLGYIGQKPIGITVFVPNVYYRWTLMMVPGILLFAKDSSKKIYVCIIAMILTLSTGAIAFTFIGIAFVLLSRNKMNVKKKRIAFSLLLICCILYSLLSFVDLTMLIGEVFSKFTSKSASTGTKLGHIESIVIIVMSDVKIFLFGMGLGSEFYSKGVNEFVVNVEVSHFNLVRQFGIIYSMLFFMYVFYVVYKLKKTNDKGWALGIGIACLFFAAGTNPLLYSPIFFIPLIVGRAYIESYKKG